MVCGPNVAHNRNILVREFLNEDYSHLLFLDDDVVPVEEIEWAKLVVLHKDILALPCPVNMSVGLTSNYQWNIFPVEGTTTELKGEGVQRVWGAGTGCMLIKREVLEAIENPFQFKRGDDESIEAGEDYVFCEKAREKGFEIWADWRHTCGHYKETDIREFL